MIPSDLQKPPANPLAPVRFLNHLIYWGTVASSALFFIMVLTSVFSRYVLKTPVMDAVEISRLAFVWACFLGAAVAHQRHSHIAITVVADRLPIGVQPWIHGFVQLLTLAVGTVLTINSIKVAWILKNSVLPIIGLSQTWFYIPLFITSLSISITSLEKLIALLQSKDNQMPSDAA